MRRSLAALLLLAAVLAAMIPSVDAHANYYASDPPRGARLTAAPRVVNVTLSEDVDPHGSSLEVRDSAGALVSQGPIRIQTGATPILSVDLRPDLGPGAYLATWKALSSVDGHATSGSWGFAVGGYEPPMGVEPKETYDPVSTAARILMYAGYALGFGALAFGMYVDPGLLKQGADRILRRCLAGAGLLLVLGVAGLWYFTMQKAALTPSTFAATDVGKLFTARLVVASATLILALAALGHTLDLRWMGPMAGLLLLDALGNSWFAHSASLGLAAIAVDLVHLVSVSMWLGGLALFFRHIKEASRTGTYEDVIRVGRRFSGLALVCVILLGSSGLLSTFLILGGDALLRPWTAWGSPYGAFLGWKVVLFAAMVAVAGVNRFVFLGKWPGPDAGAAERVRIFQALFPRGERRARAFGNAVGTEATVGLIVIVLAGFLTAVSPPSQAPAAPDELTAVGFGTDHNVTLMLRPTPAAGRSSNLSLRIEEAATGKPLEEAIRVRATLSRVGVNESGGETYLAKNAGGGTWVIGDVLFAVGGSYEARVEVQTETVFRDTIPIRFDVGGAAGSTGGNS